jgi:hypothetical protein
MKAAWLTDLHLNHGKDGAFERLCAELAEARPDGLFVTGDTAEAKTVTMWLSRLADAVGVPLYFVLGNHDFYNGSVREVRAEIISVTKSSRFVRWLPACEPVMVEEGVALVGHDGWGDGRAPDFDRSEVWLNDYIKIKELADISRTELKARLHRLGVEAAAALEPQLRAALGVAAHVVVLTHVPPFVGACWYMGKPSDQHWAPHFTCVAMGEMLARVAAEYPTRTISVLCGHTHSPGWYKAAPNLEVWTGEARYGYPQIQSVVEVSATPALWKPEGRVPVMMLARRPSF